MTPVEQSVIPPAATRLVVGEHQAHIYNPLPAYLEDGYVVSEWEPTSEEIVAMKDNVGHIRVRLKVLTFGQPVQPVIVELV